MLLLFARAVKAAVAGWGQQKLTPLEAEDRLSVACEKGFSEDPVTLQLREAFQVRLLGSWAVSKALKFV